MIEIVKYLYIQMLKQTYWSVSSKMYSLIQIKSCHLKMGKPFPWELRAERNFMFGILLQLDIWLEARRQAKK